MQKIQDLKGSNYVNNGKGNSNNMQIGMVSNNNPRNLLQNGQQNRLPPKSPISNNRDKGQWEEEEESAGKNGRNYNKNNGQNRFDDDEEDDIYAGNRQYSAQNYCQTQKQQQQQLNNQDLKRKQQLQSQQQQKQSSFDNDERDDLDEGSDQEEIAKPASISSKPTKPVQRLQRLQKEDDGLQLCPEGCGRSFNEFALEKHAKVCKKIFQEKAEKKQQGSKVSESAQNKDKERQDLLKKMKELHECPDCGRQFRYDIFEKHVKICLKVFTKKHRESSLQRKASLGTTMQTSLQPTQQLLKQTSLAEQQSQQQNVKKPPLKRLPSTSDQQKRGEQEKKPANSLRQLSEDRTPTSSTQTTNIGNEWDETPIGQSKNSKISNSNPWEDSKAGSMNKSSSLQKEKELPKKKKEIAKKPWCDDWNSQPDAAGELDYDKNSFQSGENSAESKNFNFNKQVKNPKEVKRQAANPRLQSLNTQIGSNQLANNGHDNDGDEEKEEGLGRNDEYVYLKPNIGKKIIQSAKKIPPSKYQNNEHEEEDYEDKRNSQTDQRRQQNKTTSFAKREDDGDEFDQDNEKPQFSKPFLRKNQGNQAVSKVQQQSQPKQSAKNDDFYDYQEQEITKYDKPTKNINNNNIPRRTTDPPSNQPKSSGYGKIQKPGKMEIINMDYNENEDIPLNKNGEFNKQLMQMEREIDRAEEIELFECPEGCGRKFQETALEKHVRICKKVFQKKRKAFDAAAQRQVVDTEQDGIPQLQPLKKAQNKQNTRPSQQQQKQSNSSTSSNPFDKKSENVNTKVGKNKPDWKLQSEALRAVMRQAKGIQTHSEYDKAVIQEAFKQDDYVGCDYCGRRFNEKAAERHIAFCKTKSEKDKIKYGQNNKTQKGSSTLGNKKY